MPQSPSPNQAFAAAGTLQEREGIKHTIGDAHEHVSTRNDPPKKFFLKKIKEEDSIAYAHHAYTDINMFGMGTQIPLL